MRPVSFGVLGPLQVWVEGREVAPPGRIARRMLAALLLSAGRPVDDDQLAAWTWGPRRASRGALHTASYRLRSWLADQAGPVVSLVHGAAGYRLEVPAEYVDAGRFRRLTRRASDRGDADRIGDLEEALGLWRGPVLAGLPEWTREHPEVGALERERVAALCALADAIAADGRAPSETALRQVEQLAGELPYDEAVQARWLRLLTAAGRRADALRKYDEIRRRLSEDLGVDPSAVLQDAYLTLLRDDATAAAAPATAPVVPRMLPRGVTDFSGRSGEVERLVESATSDRHERIIVIDGMAGVGKTALAVHAAHRLAPAFPDGQVFLDLQGFAESSEPVEPGVALDRMLRALGVADEQIPADVDDRAALWRSRLAERRMLVLLDNAASEAQVRPLLPAAPLCAVLVTSRRRLTGLDDVQTVSLGAMPKAEATELFWAIVGPDRADGPAVDDVVELCGRLPLAIRIAAARMRARPSWRVDDLVRRLADQTERLAELEAGDRSVAAAFRLSYQQLNGRERTLFRRLGLHAGPDIDVHAAAALADLPVRTARRLLDGLVDVHLLEQPAADRYRFHDLLASYAAALARDADAEDVRRAAAERMLNHYVSRASAAIELLLPGEGALGRPSAGRRDRFDDPEAADAWLTAEHRNLVAAAGLAARDGLPAHAIALSDSLHRAFLNRRRFDEALRLHTHALDAARLCGDGAAEGRALRWLAGVRGRMREYQTAADLCAQAIRRFRESGDRVGEYEALRLAANIKLFQGEIAAGKELLERARALDLGPDDVPASARVRMARLLAHYCRELGEYDEALGHAREGVRIASALGSSKALADAQTMLAGALHDLGRHAEAVDAYREAIRCQQVAGDLGGRCLGVNSLGRSLRALGRLDEALDCHREALSLAQELADPNLQTEAHRELGVTLRELGRPDEAVPHLERALESARQVDQRIDVSRAHDELARTFRAHGEVDRARRHWQQALAIMTDLGVRGAERVRADLAVLDRADAGT